jgi:hypothetical protein
MVYVAAMFDLQIVLTDLHSDSLLSERFKSVPLSRLYACHNICAILKLKSFFSKHFCVVWFNPFTGTNVFSDKIMK